MDMNTTAIVGMVVYALIQLRIFATKAEMAELRAEIYREFMPRRETEARLKGIEEKIDRMLDLLYSRDS